MLIAADGNVNSNDSTSVIVQL